MPSPINENAQEGRKLSFIILQGEREKVKGGEVAWWGVLVLVHTLPKTVPLQKAAFIF